MSTPAGGGDPFAAPDPAAGGVGRTDATPAGPTGGTPTSPPGPPAYPGSPDSHAASGPPVYPGVPAYPGAPVQGAQPGGYGAPGGYGGGAEANNLAVWSLVLALLGWVCTGLLTSIPAIVVGHRARRAAAQGRANNPGMATAGIVLGWIATVLNLVVLVVLAVLVATRGWDGVAEMVQDYGSWPTAG